MTDAQNLKNIMANNLKKYIKQSGKNQTDIANELGIPKMTISNWINAKTYPRADKIQLLSDYFGIPRSYLTEEQPTNIEPISPRVIRIPILGEIACGEPLYVEENFSGYKEEIADFVPKGNMFYLVANGDSMEPTIPNGAYVMVREQPTVETGEIAAVLVNGNTEATLKRVKKQSGIVLLVPDNPRHEPIIVSKENPARIIGKAIKYTQDL